MASIQHPIASNKPKPQLIVQLLTPFPTRALLPLTAVSQRFHNIILRILHYRLLLAASLKEYRLILECYHPSTKWTEPYLFCTYLGTDGLSSKHEGEGSLYADCANAARLQKLSGLYSRFRPARPEEERHISRPHPAGGSGTTSIYSNDPDACDQEKLVAHQCQSRVPRALFPAVLDCESREGGAEAGAVRELREPVGWRGEDLAGLAGGAREGRRSGRSVVFGRREPAPPTGRPHALGRWEEPRRAESARVPAEMDPALPCPRASRRGRSGQLFRRTGR